MSKNIQKDIIVFVSTLHILGIFCSSAHIFVNAKL